MVKKLLVTKDRAASAAHRTKPVPDYTVVTAEPYQTELIEYLEGWDGEPLRFYRAENAVTEYVRSIGRNVRCVGHDFVYETYPGSGNPEFILSTEELLNEDLSAIGKRLLEEAGLLEETEEGIEEEAGEEKKAEAEVEQ